MSALMYMGENCSGGPAFLSSLKDVGITSIEDKQILLYDSTTRTWKNHSITASDITYGNTNVGSELSALNTTLGSTSISGIGDGTVTGAISTLNNSSTVYSTTVNGQSLLYNDYMCDLQASINPFMSSPFLNIPSAYRPTRAVNTIGRFTPDSEHYYPALVTINTDGNVSASYFTSTGVVSASSGAIVFHATWLRQ